MAELRRIARALDKNQSSSGPLVRLRFKTGTRLFRKWRGQTHKVFVTESDFEHRRVRYRSLSEIARKIPGTRWSGSTFFGLKKASSVPGHRDE